MLKEQGKLDDTVIVFTSDNGYLWGEHRLRTKGKPYDESIHVPLVVRDGRTPVGKGSHALVLNVDLAPTFLDLAGIPIPPSVDGRSFAAQLTAKPPAGRAEILFEHWGFPHGSPTHDGIRTHRWKFVDYVNGGEELYDLDADPHELTSLHADPKLAKTRKTLKSRLKRIRSCRGATCP